MVRTADGAERIPLRDNPTGRGLILVVLALMAVGVVMVHSASGSVSEPGGAWHGRRDIRHTIFAGAAILLLLGAWRLPYRWLTRGGKLPLLAAGLLFLALVGSALVYVPGLGHSVGGRFRWLRVWIGGVSLTFQPSELIKVAMVIFLAAWLTREGGDVRSFRRTFLPALGVVGLCVGAVIREDFGTAMLIGATGGAVLLLGGVPWYLLSMLVAGAGAGFYAFVVRDPRRWERVLVLLDPWSSTNPAAYQPRQSIIAIVNGGWFGRGVGNGVSKLGFLPEDCTDFIFSVYCEEWGVMGAMLLMGLLLMWIWHARRACIRAADPLGSVLAGSLGFLIAFQAVLHIAVDLVVAPPTGIGLPFVSAGGTRLLILSGAAALMVSVTARGGPVPAASAPAKGAKGETVARGAPAG